MWNTTCPVLCALCPYSKLIYTQMQACLRRSLEELSRSLMTQGFGNILHYTSYMGFTFPGGFRGEGSRVYRVYRGVELLRGAGGVGAEDVQLRRAVRVPQLLPDGVPQLAAQPLRRPCSGCKPFIPG